MSDWRVRMGYDCWRSTDSTKYSSSLYTNNDPMLVALNYFRAFRSRDWFYVDFMLVTAPVSSCRYSTNSSVPLVYLRRALTAFSIALSMNLPRY